MAIVQSGSTADDSTNVTKPILSNSDNNKNTKSLNGSMPMMATLTDYKTEMTNTSSSFRLVEK